MMFHPAPLARCVLALTASGCWGQIVHAPLSLRRSVEIELPPAVASETFFIRYCLTAIFGGYCGWVQPQRNVHVYAIRAEHGGRPATNVRALLYAPGCAVETVDFSVTDLKDQHYTFACRPLPIVSISGVLTRVDRLYGRAVGLRAKYIPYWAEGFFGTPDGIGTIIPVSDLAYPTADNHFRLLVPDFSQDPLVGAADHPGALQIWATDRVNGNTVALVVPTEQTPAGIKTKIGGLRIQGEYPQELVFAPCLANPRPARDGFGFSLRPGADACDP